MARIPPAEGVQDIVPVREKVRSPDGVQVQVEDKGRTPAAGREGTKDQKRALDRTERVVVLGAWGRAVGTLDPCGVADREEADEAKDKEGDGKVEDEHKTLEIARKMVVAWKPRRVHPVG
ncbi:hypothetical protein G6F36_014950 [Rhizopus arrhizus]|nr:hypothetical protein G6F36_014950 [Rhizopus arrhizus]